MTLYHADNRKVVRQEFIIIKNYIHKGIQVYTAEKLRLQQSLPHNTLLAENEWLLLDSK